MIKVEEVINKNADKESEKFRNAGQPLPGSIREVKKSYLPWAGIILLAGFAAWFFFFRKKGSNSNEGVSG